MATCANGSETFGPQMAWSKKDSSNWLAHALGAPESTSGLGGVRGSIENRSSTGAAKSRVAYRLSNDGSTWQSWSPLYTSGTNEQTNDGTAFGPSYVDLSSVVEGYQLIQWGAQVINTSGAATEIVNVVIKLDRK